ncbi:MAG: cell division protein FtsQ/DivIB [Gammaproteobacteria bacterium]
MILGERIRPQAAPRARPAEEAAPRRPLGWLFALLAAALVAAGVTLLEELRDPMAFPIRRVTVDGDFRYLAPANLRKTVSGAVRGGFFHVDVQHVRDTIMEEPWVREATVQRLWPDTLNVSIVEQQPVAYWGEHALLNDAGDLFVPARMSFPAGLIRLDGPVGTEIETLEAWRHAVARLAPLGLEVAAVSLSERRALTLRLADGATIVLGRRAAYDRLERFVAAYRTVLRDNWTRIAVVDLRYTNGFAIRERTEAAATPATAATASPARAGH